MYNEEILKKIVDQFGLENATSFCQVASTMYDIKYNACKSKECFTEYDYERDWWHQAYLKLSKEIEV